MLGFFLVLHFPPQSSGLNQSSEIYSHSTRWPKWHWLYTDAAQHACTTGKLKFLVEIEEKQTGKWKNIPRAAGIYNVTCNYPMTMCAHVHYLRKIQTAAELLFVITCSV